MGRRRTRAGRPAAAFTAATAARGAADMRRALYPLAAYGPRPDRPIADPCSNRSPGRRVPSMATVDTAHRLPSLDGLRAISIGFVIVSHLVPCLHLAWPPGVLALFELGRLGVRV